MAERGRHIHDTVDHDRGSLKRLLDVGLEDPGDMQFLDIDTSDLLGRVEARLRKLAVGQ
jgi:hypothetical protein